MVYNFTYKAEVAPLSASQVQKCLLDIKKKAKQYWTGPEGSRNVEFLRFQDNRHTKVVRLSALRYRPPLPPQEIPLVFMSVRGCVDPRAIVRPEGLCQ